MKGTIQLMKEFPKNTVLQIDDVRYSLYGRPEGLKVGDTVEFTFVQNDQWKNLKEIKKVDWNEAKEEVIEKSSSFQSGSEVKYTGSLKVKSFIYATPMDLETALNKFGSENRVKFTQTHVLPAVQEGDTLRFVAFCWFE